MAQSPPGELVMRGPQFMLGYWNAPEATAAVLRDGWYWSGDVATIDDEVFYRIVDRRKEMIKYKGFPDETRVDAAGGLGRPDSPARNSKLAGELCDFVAQRLSGYKQPRDVRFVTAIPRNPSGKILRRQLRDLL